MEFETEIFQLLSKDPGLIDKVGDEIYSHNLPENFDFNRPSVVLQYQLEETLDSMGEKEVLEYFTLHVVILSKSTSLNKEISRTVRNILMNMSGSTLRDGQFVTEQNSVDFDKGYYVKSLQYRVIYEPQTSL